jgi:16S rRNA (cytidine1402-2'-O)-methyltransferase
MPVVFVPTPLGNLGDITLRAIETLKSADLIAAEDTRVARRLLSALGIDGKRLVSYREHNAARVTAAILEAAREGTVALTSDAGMPAVSDPGRALLLAARAAEIDVDVLPGPVAFITAAVISGFPIEGLLFGGFLPRSPGKLKRALRGAAERDGATAFYESPHRIAGTLKTLAGLAPFARVFVGRELTKRFETHHLGTPADVLAALAIPVRGEIVLVVGPADTLSAENRP